MADRPHDPAVEAFEAVDDGQRRYDEGATLQPGTEAVAFDMRSRDGEVWRIGLGICYDLRFPELYRAMGAVDIIVVPAAFTATTGKAHFETLVRARAIENLDSPRAMPRVVQKYGA